MNASQTFLMRNPLLFERDMLVVWQYYGTFVKS